MATSDNSTASPAYNLGRTNGTGWATRLLLACMLLSLVLLALGLIWIRPAAAAVPGPEFTVAKAAENQVSPVLAGDTVVWQDYRNLQTDIYARDLESGLEFEITTDPNRQGNPDADGDTVVWADDRNGGEWEIFGYNLRDRSEFRITTDTAGNHHPAISGNIVVWDDDRRGKRNLDIYGKNLKTGQVFRITSNDKIQSHPAISGHLVVWRDLRNGNLDIYGKNLKTGKEFQITRNADAQDMPAISGDTVVWRDARTGGNYDIYGRKLNTGKELRITSDTSDQVSPDVSGRIVVWSDGRDGDSNIYGRDLSTGKEFEVTSSGDPEESPALEDETVVWEAQLTGDAGYGSLDVRGSDLDIAPLAPEVTTAKGTTTGINLAWKAHREDDISGYNVYRSTSATGGYTKLNVDGLVTSLSYKDSGAERGAVSYYRITAVDRANSESAFASAKGAALAPTTLTLKASSRVATYGNSVTLSGRLSSEGKVSGRRVILQEKPKGARTFSRVSKQPASGVPTEADGTFRLPGVEPAEHTHYRARFVRDSGAGLLSSTSTVKRVQVRAKVSLRVSDTRVGRGDRVRIFGAVAPTQRGSVRVIIEGNGRIVSRRSVSLHKVSSSRSVSLRASRYELTYRPPFPGKYNVRVIFAGDANHLKDDATRDFRVVR